MNTYISAIDYYLPRQVVRTRDMMAATQPARFGFAETLIEDTVGIFEVRHAAENQKPSTLATIAVERALSKFEGNPNDIGMIIFCGIERDYIEPSTAHFIQKNLGLKNAVCFDVTNACLGFMTGIQIAVSAILSGAEKHVLVCTGEVSSRVSKNSITALGGIESRNEYYERIGVLTVGDAGAAAVISHRDDGRGMVGLNFVSRGQLADLCHYKYEQGVPAGIMKMREICNAGLKLHKNMLPRTLQTIGKSINDVDCLITHQVGKVAWEGFSRFFNVEGRLMTKTFDKLGNITSATFGVNYAMGLEQGSIKKGDFVLAAMAGSGLTTCQVGILV